MLGLLTFNNRENPIPFLVRPNNKGRPVLPRPFLSCHSVILSIVFVCSKRPGLLQQPDFPLNFLIRGFFFVVQSLYHSYLSYQNICSHSQWPPNLVVLPHFGHTLGRGIFSSCSSCISIFSGVGTFMSDSTSSMI